MAVLHGACGGDGAVLSGGQERRLLGDLRAARSAASEGDREAVGAALSALDRRVRDEEDAGEAEEEDTEDEHEPGD